MATIFKVLLVASLAIGLGLIVASPAEIAEAPTISKPEAPDCSAMEDPLHVGGFSDPLYCARERAGKLGGECVVFIQRLTGSYYTNPDFRGYAGDIEPNIKEPRVGDVVLENEIRGSDAHASLIYAISGDSLTLVESNEYGDGIVTFGRNLKKDSWRIRGYYRFYPPVDRPFDPSAR